MLRRFGSLLLGLAAAVGVAGCGNTSFVITPVTVSQAMEEREVLRESPWTTIRIAVIDVDGILTNAREKSFFGPPGDNPVSVFKEKLDIAAQDSRVKAVVVRINSPGGTVTASDLMYSELRNFRERTGKPVIASMLDLAASGGYYLACAADRIYAHPTSVTGSIGVIMITPDLTGLMDKVGVQANVIKSGAMKDMGSPFRTMNDRDRSVLQAMIDQMYERFFAVVKNSRKNVEESKLRALADGRVYFAPEAKENGLVDEVGSLGDAVRGAKAAAGIADKAVVVVQYARPLAYRPNIYAESPTEPGRTQVNYLNVELPDFAMPPTTQFMYLWSPTW